MKQSTPATNQARKPHIVFITAVFVGALAGVLIGLLAMSVGLLVIGAFSLVMDLTPFQLPGLSMPAVTFVTCFVLGWVGTAVVVYRRLKSRNK